HRLLAHRAFVVGLLQRVGDRAVFAEFAARPALLAQRALVVGLLQRVRDRAGLAALAGRSALLAPRALVAVLLPRVGVRGCGVGVGLAPRPLRVAQRTLVEGLLQRVRDRAVMLGAGVARAAALAALARLAFAVGPHRLRRRAVARGFRAAAGLRLRAGQAAQQL